MKKRTTVTQSRTDYISVTNTDANEFGVLPVCGLLQAIARHNDSITTAFFHTSSVSNIYCRRYHVQFAGNAHSGDTLLITSTWRQNDGQLHITLVVNKKVKGKVHTICHGQFAFTHQLAQAS